MAGMFPSGGVPANQTQGATTGPDLAPGCVSLWYAPKCNPKFDPFAMNGLMSELVEIMKCADHTYDCNLQTNLVSSLLKLQDANDVFVSGAIAQIVLAGGSTQLANSVVGPTLTQQIDINNPSDCASMYVSIYGECNYSLSGNGLNSSFQQSIFEVSVNGGANQILSSAQWTNFGGDNFVVKPSHNRRGIVNVIIPPGGLATLRFYVSIETLNANWTTAAAYQTTASGFAWYSWHLQE